MMKNRKALWLLSNQWFLSISKTQNGCFPLQVTILNNLFLMLINISLTSAVGKHPIIFFMCFLIRILLSVWFVRQIKIHNSFCQKILIHECRFLKSKNITVEDISSFLCLLLWMGLMRLPSISDYWGTAEIYTNCLVGKIFCRNKFKLILQFWYFVTKKTP